MSNGLLFDDHTSAVPSGIDAHQRRMRLDIGLMNRRHRESILDDHVGLAKAFFDHALFPGQVTKTLLGVSILCSSPLYSATFG